MVISIYTYIREGSHDTKQNTVERTGNMTEYNSFQNTRKLEWLEFVLKPFYYTVMTNEEEEIKATIKNRRNDCEKVKRKR